MSRTEDSVQHRVGDFWRSLKAVKNAESPEEKFEQKEIFITYGEAGAYLGLAIFNFLSAIKIHKELIVKKARLQREKGDEKSEEDDEWGSLEGGEASLEERGRSSEGIERSTEGEKASETRPNSENQKQGLQELRSYVEGQLEERRQVQELQKQNVRVHKLQRIRVQGALGQREQLPRQYKYRNQGQGLKEQAIPGSSGISFKKRLFYNPNYNINSIRD